MTNAEWIAKRFCVTQGYVYHSNSYNGVYFYDPRTANYEAGSLLFSDWHGVTQALRYLNEPLTPPSPPKKGEGEGDKDAKDARTDGQLSLLNNERKAQDE